MNDWILNRRTIDAFSICSFYTPNTFLEWQPNENIYITIFHCNNNKSTKFVQGAFNSTLLKITYTMSECEAQNPVKVHEYIKTCKLTNFLHVTYTTQF